MSKKRVELDMDYQIAEKVKGALQRIGRGSVEDIVQELRDENSGYRLAASAINRALSSHHLKGVVVKRSKDEWELI
jgi:hypothetical protein